MDGAGDAGGGRPSHPKLMELLAARRRAAAAQQQEAADSPEKEGETKPVGGEARPTKGIGRAEFLAKLKRRDEKVGVSSTDKSSDDPGSKPTSRAELLARLKANKAKKAEESVAEGGVDAGNVSDGKSSGFSVRADDVEEMARKLEEARIAPTLRTDRRQTGSKGRVFEASANIVRINLLEDMGCFEYHCRFCPEIDSIQDKKKIIRQLVPTIGETRLFDGATLCLPKLLEAAVTVCNATSISGESVKVTITLVKRRPMSKNLQLFNVLFCSVFEILKLVEIKRNYYDPTIKMMIPAHKLEIWPGYVNRVTECDGGLMLICDTRNKVLRQENALTIIEDVMKKGGKQHEIQKALLGSIVMTEYNKAQTYKIEDIDFTKSPLTTFTMSSGEEISFKEYYSRFYQLQIKNTQQPLLVYREKKKVQGEETERVICLVPELCRMTGLTDSMIADFRVMKDVAAHTRLTPEQRQQSLKKFLANVDKNAECKELLARWGLELDKEPIRLKGRTLDAEKLQFGNNKTVTVNFKCDWGRESTTTPCLVPVNIKSWHVVTTVRNKTVTEGFIKLTKTLASKMGINVAEPTLSVLQNDRSETYVQDIRKFVTPTTELVVAVVPQQREDRYATLKRLCNTELPVASQVICSKTISNEKKVQSVVQKIILQINCKLGGELWGVKLPVPNFMIIGIDVYHDPSRKKESVIGAVCSLNTTHSQWASESAFQKPGQEITDVMMPLIGNLITRFKEKNNAAPDKIVLYRDGVGDGQLDQLDFYEAERCMDQFKICGIKPEFAFIVVQKRINRRFFEMKGSRYENPPPGSVLDHTVMKPDWDDFLLVSQHSSQSVVCPTHYIIVKNTTTFSVDQIQKITYKMTHMYFNWPGTVRVPAPCQYAHKLAYQIGEATRADPSPLLCNRLFFL